MSYSQSYKFIAFLLAFLMLISSAGFSLDLHYCQGNFKNLAFFKEAKSCHELAKKSTSAHCKKMQTPCSKKDSSTTGVECEKSCCSRNTILVEAETNILSAKIITADYFSAYFMIAFVYSFVPSNTSTEYLNKYLLYKPPPQDKDLSVLFQTFLI